MIVLRFLLLPDWRDHVRAIAPRVTEAQLTRIAALIDAGGFLAEDGTASPELAAILAETQPAKETQ